MAFCSNCGTQYEDGAKYCPTCGATIGAAPQQQAAAGAYTAPAAPLSSEEQDVQQNKVFAVLSYFGILVLIPIFAAAKSKFARFHANNGLNLLILEVAVGVIFGLLKLPFREKIWGIVVGYSTGWYIVAIIQWLLYVAIAVLAIMGIVYAAQGKMKDLPIVSKVKLLK